jgi:trk system potassium uptake protein
MKLININIVFKVVSRILFIVTGSLLICSVVGLIYSEPVSPFLFSSAGSLLLGLLLHIFTGKKNGENRLQRKEAYLTVTISWVMISLAGSLPYILSGAIPSVTDAIFESVSGFTTTGSSILSDIEALPKSILFWRSLTHWIGGIGIIVLVIVAMHTLQIGGYHLFMLESSLQEKFKPKIKTVGVRLFTIYVLLTLAEVGLLLAGDMNLFESLCHAFATISTGGFSPRNTSIAEYSPYIQYVIIIFMFLSGTNFVVHYFLLKRDFRKVRDNEEFRFYAGVTLIIGLVVSLALIFQMNKPVEEAIREGFFQVVSIVTCTGFATADYLQWPEYAWLIIFLAMFLGGSTGSTSGGIKMARYLVLYKNISILFRKLIHPHAVISLRLNKKPLSSASNSSILTFITIYFLVFLAGSLILVVLGTDIKTASSAVATCMANIGPGIGTIGPAGNFSHLPDLVKIILSIIMIVGRLEIYTVLILFTRSFWKK